MSSRPWTAQGQLLFYDRIFCCIPSDWSKDLRDTVNCNRHLKHASIYHSSSAKCRYSTPLRLSPCWVLSWFNTTSFGVFLCYVEYLITKYFIFILHIYMSVLQRWHKNLLLFCDFSSLWVLIIIPTRENFFHFLLALHSSGWKLPSMSFLK